MATRTLDLSVETKLCTNYADDYVKVSVTSNNYAFGNDVPTHISFAWSTSVLRADYSGGVTFEWEIILHFNNDASVTVYEGTVTSCTSTTDLSVSDIALPSAAVSALQQSTIDYIELYPTRENRRLLRGRGGSATCTITYTEVAEVTPSIEWSNRTVTCTQNGDAVNVSWYPAVGYDGSGSVYYYLFCGSEDNVVYSGTATSATVYPPTYNEQYAYYVKATYSTAPERWSTTTYFTATKSTQVHYTIRCYLNGSWQDCIIKYFDGTGWIECVPNYCDGSSWKTCSF